MQRRDAIQTDQLFILALSAPSARFVLAPFHFLNRTHIHTRTFFLPSFLCPCSSPPPQPLLPPHHLSQSLSITLFLPKSKVSMNSRSQLIQHQNGSKHRAQVQATRVTFFFFFSLLFVCLFVHLLLLLLLLFFFFVCLFFVCLFVYLF